MTEFIQQHLLELGGYAIAGAVYFTRGEADTKNNSGSISRLEKAIENLIIKIDKLIETQGDFKVDIANLQARVNSLEER